MRVLSLFDGMACGMIALLNAGVNVESYDAYEIDKYAVKTATHNFPMIREHGDVFNTDFTIYRGIDWLIGGSPCTHWSIAQTVNRETSVRRDEKGDILLHSSGIGFELFSQYLRAIDEAQPRFFIYENNKSMSADIRAAITECFGFEPIGINSALLSAQNRQRLYWVGKRNQRGGYDRVIVEQPTDKGILLKDILDNGIAYKSKANCLAANRGGESLIHDLTESRHNYAAVPINCTADGKAKTISASYAYKGDGEGSLKSELFPYNPIKQTSNYVAEPICVNTKSGKGGIQPSIQDRIYSTEGKAVAVTGGFKNRIAEPINTTVDGKAHTIKAQYAKNSTKKFFCDGQAHYDASGVAEEADILNDPSVYKVENGFVAIKGEQYPIKLPGGYYRFRKLSVSECKRLQTVPEWYEFPVSNTQAYKMLGNGWTCDVITHLINACLDGKVDEQLEQLSWF